MFTFYFLTKIVFVACLEVDIFIVPSIPGLYKAATAPSFSLQCLLDGSSNLARGYCFWKSFGNHSATAFSKSWHAKTKKGVTRLLRRYIDTVVCWPAFPRRTPERMPSWHSRGVVRQRNTPLLWCGNQRQQPQDPHTQTNERGNGNLKTTKWGGTSGDMLGSLWGHSGIILDSLWAHSGTVLGSFWRHFGDFVWGRGCPPAPHSYPQMRGFMAY